MLSSKEYIYRFFYHICADKLGCKLITSNRRKSQIQECEQIAAFYGDSAFFELLKKDSMAIVQ